MSTYLHDQVTFATGLLALRARAAGGAGETDQVVADAVIRRAQLKQRIEEAPPLDLARRLALTPTELGVMWTLVAAALSPEARQLLGDPTVDVLRSVVYGHGSLAAFRELGPDGTLRRYQLIEPTGGDVHESRQTWAISRRVLGELHGDDSIDPALAGVVRIPDDAKRPGELAVSAGVVEAVRAAMSSGAIVVAAGAPGLGRRSVLVAAAREAGIAVVEVDGKRLGKGQLRLALRECKLRGATPLVCNADAIADGLDELDGPVFATTNRPIRWARPAIVVELGPPSSGQRETLWRAALGEGSADDAEYLATQFPLAPALIGRAAAAARVRATGRKLRPDDVYAGVRAVLDDRLGAFARRVEVTQRWDDLVLPADQEAEISYLIARIRQRRTVYEQWGFGAKVGRGLGVTALFSGPPGTGKTMVAALLAQELGLELYQVDLANVVSKWIGETEAHLGALFDAAEAGHAILLFDEADALFGKRTDVRSSNDRHANGETNYLLQRLESFRGICLLTSNHEASIDPAFQRRLALHVRFALLDEAERAHLWRAMLPAAAPVDDELDLRGLARRFAISGGYIRNAALRAAFVAADEGSPITAAHLARAAQAEVEAMGRIAA